MAEQDSISARISENCPPETQQILTAAWAHDVEKVKKLLDAPGKASCQDPKTGETPLHAAIRACGPPSEDDTPEDLEAAKNTVYELLLWGGIWNDVDDHNETPGCLAFRLGRPELYNLCVEAGVRAEMLFGLLDGRTKTEKWETTTSETYLRSKLTYDDGKLVDDDGNGVMMAWETDIMRQSVDALLPNRPSGKRVLNIGMGMGIIDSMFAEIRPARHHIIEAHPEVLEHLSAPDAKFGSSWEESGPEPGAFKVYEGKWQEICHQLLEEGQVYDAIYFDTFGEDYGQLRMFFTEFIPGLLDREGIFGFFNGLGADRKICYDVYTKVAEMHLADAGLDVDFKEIDVDMKELAEAGKGEWEGVKRRYWTLDSQFSPSFCQHDGLLTLC
ncbi:S-adenosyl-L-methionine-dependent methyltransferase [Cercophora scortea]|uniref:Arginine N-methyltransferase 2 n=1 Tax=Cercophora scortea TaxID=314031 RepID=A0AAE0J3A5_9PEZI|nr:S-adenosyl-L-methionine-dependent methyltransferase [Cercophora scortea]